MFGSICIHTDSLPEFLRNTNTVHGKKILYPQIGIMENEFNEAIVPILNCNLDFCYFKMKSFD